VTSTAPAPAAELEPAASVARLVARLAAAGQTLAVAESLTGGLLCATLVEVPGVSAVLRGGVVAYATDLKAELLGVDADLLAEHGPVHGSVALAMADGVRQRLGATWGVATTGVAGPDPQDGQPPGTAFIAVTDAEQWEVQRLQLDGDRDQVRRAVVAAALEALGRELEHGGPPTS
jgi:nicotinamide-nucleotide amidase